ncbi:MAG: DNA mismatch repair endonuclease MutL [Acidobacteriota bacterium]|jgi:DNA mismatch repair protein MutL|nr:DNA mismatch repair endonuclease MutL [Acidobacteriota bacterium]
MNKIKILTDNLANQIAAGEVVERPASVIKELVENSIDAGAKRIKIEIELGGRRLMRVADDGEGMVRDDAILAFERHATSKISELKDLGNIETLGFRGEALASIASVAKVELVTKIFDGEAATKVQIEGGKLIDVKEAARPTGTTITVRDLFFNTPARRKFMRSQATENYHITNTVTHYALSNPEIAFTLTNNGRDSIRVSPAKDLRERAYQLFGSQMIESLLPVQGGREFIAQISGYISAPRERRTTRDSQYFFINGRYVKDKIIAGGLLEGYRSVLPHGVYPVAFLFLEIPHEELDVNVHPAKTEVRFRRSQAVKDVIAEAIRQALQNAGIVSGSEFRVENSEFEKQDSELTKNQVETSGTLENPQEAQSHNLETQPTETTIPQQSKMEFQIPTTSQDFESLAINRSEIGRENATNRWRDGEINEDNFDQPQNENQIPTAEDRKPKTEDQTEIENRKSKIENYPELPPVDSAESIPQSIEVENVSAAKIQPIGQLHNSFIIAADDEGLLLIDQHVAHERILFDKFRRRETDRKIESQNLLLPETIDLTPAQASAFEEVEAELENYGFGLMKLSGRTIAIKSVPTDLPPSEVRNLFAEILDTIEKDKRGGAKATLRDDIAASLACKAAVKINMKLTPEKMRWMIDQLLTTSSPTTCPHGRPIILRLTMKDIERKFHRT